ncbi:substrate-binding domain-containing protein [Pseudomonas sp. 21LCFQ02]|uniref:LysR substrate-binding domain-containing protein n=1 Tax=unclassified Pseudomonas TaxID=196821 RepID=UPI00209B7D42|nr:substrate-binding domain-containing protein [Pseudomonas sp. 21LCFQ02]MCQ9427141.1 substrate-binding domain-containing protein [Pseudomonas sp. LJDD11]
MHYSTHVQETNLGASLDFLARNYPDIQLSVLHSNDPHPSLDPLQRELADILILPSTVLDEQHIEHHRWSDHYVLVIARHLCKTAPPLSDLARSVRYVAWRHPGQERLHSQMASAQLRLSHRGELSCLDTLLDLVIKGHCLTVLPSALLPVPNPGLEYLTLPVPVTRRISVVARPTSLLSSAATVVIDALKKSSVFQARGKQTADAV